VVDAGRERRHRLAFWTSPFDQPAWARPALLVTAAAAAYGWGAGRYLEIYYAAVYYCLPASAAG